MSQTTLYIKMSFSEHKFQILMLCCKIDMKLIELSVSAILGHGMRRLLSRFAYLLYDCVHHVQYS